MRLDSSKKNTFSVINENFLLPFLWGTFLSSSILIILSVQTISQKTLIFLAFISLTLLFYFWLKKNKENKLLNSAIIALSKHFLIALFVIAIFLKLLSLEVPENSFFVIQLLLIFFTTTLTYYNRECLHTKNCNGSINVKEVIIFTIVIVGLFVFQYSHINDRFFDNFNSEKYVSYVPTAQNIVETKNPFTFRNGNYTDLEQSVAEQNFSKYWELPIYFWILAIFQSFVPYISVEAAAHGAMFFLGSILLVLVYFYLRIFFEPKYSYLATILFGISPIFTLLSRLTTFDTIALVFFFAAIFAHHKNNTPLALILLSFSVLSKLSFGLIGVVFFGVLFLMEKKYELLPKLAGNLALIFISFQLLVAPVPSYATETLISILLLFSFSIVCLLSYKITSSFNYDFKKIIYDKRLYLVGIPIFIILVLVWKNNVLNIASQFLVSPSQLLNVPLYDVLYQRILMVTNPIVTFFPLLLITPLLIKKIRNNPYFLALLISGFFYFVISAKSIRYAYYYNHIFVLILIILATYIVMFVNNIFFRDRLIIQNLIIASTLIISLFLVNSSHTLVWKVHPKLTSADSVINFINSNSKAEDKILILDTEFQTLFQYTNRAVIVITAIRNTPERSRLDELKNEIGTTGFYNTMKNYNVKFLITDKRNDDLTLFNYLLTPSDTPNPLDRNQLIYGKAEITPDTSITGVSSYFQLVQTFGHTKIYELTDSVLIN